MGQVVERYYRTGCHQSSCGTTLTFKPCDEQGNDLPHHNASSCVWSDDIDIKYKGIIKVTYEVIRRGKPFPKNPFGYARGFKATNRKGNK